jgi:thymidylate kinase
MNLYEKKAKEKNKLFLKEEICVNMTANNLEEIKGGRLIESNGGKYEALAILKNVPVSRYTENQNGRVYQRPLWEKIFKEGTYKGTFALADHPENEGSVKDIWGIWHEMEVKNDGVYGTLYLIEEKPVRVLKAGGSIGISSCGYGEFTNGNIVDPNSYELERLGDIVLNPSQSTYMKTENIVESINNENSSNLQESYTNNSKANKLDDNIKLQENKKEVYMDKSILKNMVLNEIKRSKNNPNLLEAIQELKELDCSGDVELINKVDITIDTITAKLNESKGNVEKELTESTNKLNEMTEKYNKLAEAYKNSKAKTIELTESTKLMESDIKCLVEDTNRRDNDIKCLAEDRKLMVSDLKKMIEDRKALRKDIKGLADKLKEAEEVIGKQEDELEKRGFEFEEEEEELDADGNPIIKEEEMVAPDTLPNENVGNLPIAEEGDEQELPMQIDPLPTEPVMAEEEDEIMTLDFDDEDVDTELEEEDAFDAFALDGEEMEEPIMEDDEMEIEELPTEEVKEEEMPAPSTLNTPPTPAPAPIAIEEPKPEEAKLVEDDDEDEKEDEDEKPEEKEEMKESVIKFSWDKPAVKKVAPKTKMVESTLKADLKKFYEKQITKTPSVKAIEKQIMSAKSLLEAFDMVDTFKSRKGDKLVKVTESASKDGVIKFKF